MLKRLKLQTSIGLFLIATSTLTQIPLASSVEYYRWVDEEGVTHFSSQPSNDHKSEKLKSVYKPPVEDVPDEDESASSEGTDGSESSDDPTDLFEQKRREIEQARKENCKKVKDRLQVLQSNSRIKLTNQDGSFSYLDESSLKAEVDKTKKAISDLCD